MKTVLTMVAGAALATVIAMPALAQDEVDPETLTCEDFLAMMPEDQATAVEALETASTESTGGTSAEGEAGAEDTAAEGDASATTETDDDTSEDVAASDEMVASLTTACEGDPEMLAMDAMADM